MEGKKEKKEGREVIKEGRKEGYQGRKEVRKVSKEGREETPFHFLFCRLTFRIYRQSELPVGQN